MFYNNVFKVIVSSIIVLLMVLVLSPTKADAADVGKTAASFLNIGPGARPSGFGNAYSAVASGADATYWNPAGMANLEYSEVVFSHFSWYQDLTLEYGAIAFPVSERLVAGVSFIYMNYGFLEGFDASGQSTGELSAYDMAAGFSIGWKAGERVSLGFTAKYIRQQLHTFDATSFAGDIGLKYDFEKVSIAAGVQNFGTEIKFDQVAEKLPTAMKFGLAARPFGDDLIASIELNKQFDGGATLSQGMEYSFQGRYYLRSGYNRMLGNSGRSFISDLSVGGGVKVDFGSFDYAYTPQDGIISDDLHRFTVIFQLGK